MQAKILFSSVAKWKLGRLEVSAARRNVRKQKKMRANAHAFIVDPFVFISEFSHRLNIYFLAPRYVNKQRGPTGGAILGFLKSPHSWQLVFEG